VFGVIYFGGYVPLHGTEYIVLAAHSLATNEGISFELVGNGQAYDQTRALADELGLTNISFVKTGMPGQWLSPQELAERIGQADLCLGVFGRGEKLDRVIPSKVYVALAMMKPVITSDSPAVRELLTHRESAFLVDKGEPHSLALAIDQLSKDRELRERIAAGGYDVFSRRASTAAVAQDLVRVLEEAVAARQKDGTQA
jgi:glycosyltransferase involved in cell wall biosynthesis